MKIQLNLTKCKMGGVISKLLFTTILLSLIFPSISGYAEEPYGRLSEDGETVTFYFDNDKLVLQGINRTRGEYFFYKQ